MTNEQAVIIAAGITAIVNFGMFFISKRLNDRAENRKTKEKFFYAVFEKRLALYDDFCRWIKDIPVDIMAVFNSNPKDKDNVLKVFKKKHENRLVAFELQAMLLGDTLFAKKCHELNGDFLQTLMNESKDDKSSTFDIISLVTGLSTNQAYNFIADFSEEAFPAFLDSFVASFLESEIKVPKPIGAVDRSLNGNSKRCAEKKSKHKIPDA